MKTIVLIAQGRFGLLKIASLITALEAGGRVSPLPVLAVRAGQEREEADAVAEALGLQERLRRIPVEPGSDVAETAALMLALEELFTATRPDLVVPGGFGNAAVAAALTATRMGIPLVSIDAGLRSYDRTDPEEANRLLIDALASLHFVSEHSGVYNLMNEGFGDDHIRFAGNTSIDSLVEMIGGANRSGVLADLGVEPKQFALLLLSTPFTGEASGLLSLLGALSGALGTATTLLLPVAPGAEATMQEAFREVPQLRIVAVPSPVDLLRLLKEASFVLTDTDQYESELTVMNVPCLTMRQTTARPSTVEVGTNVLVGFDEAEILEHATGILSGKPAGKTLIPEKWDGAAAKRIAEVLEQAG